MKTKLDESIVKQYGEQVIRDTHYAKRTPEDCSWGNAMVARACGQIDEKDEERFRKAIQKYAEDMLFGHALLKECNKVRKRCSKKVTVKSEFTKGQLGMLKRRYQDEFNQAKKEHPSIFKNINFEHYVVKLAVFEVINSEMERVVK